MKTVQIQVKEKIYDNFLKTIGEFDKDEVEILLQTTNTKEHTNNSLREIEDLIKQLSSSELKQARQLFYNFDQKLWDMKIEQDSKSGNLDELVHDALEEYQREEVDKL